MRVAIVAPPVVPVPPAAYAGTETTLDSLARGLADAGHDVLLYTTGDSTCPVERDWTFEQAWSRRPWRSRRDTTRDRRL